MPVREELPPYEYESIAPNAILERMRRRIARVGLLVAFVCILLTALMLFIVCVWARLR